MFECNRARDVYFQPTLSSCSDSPIYEFSAVNVSVVRFERFAVEEMELILERVECVVQRSHEFSSQMQVKLRIGSVIEERIQLESLSGRYKRLV